MVRLPSSVEEKSTSSIVRICTSEDRLANACRVQDESPHNAAHNSLLEVERLWLQAV